MVLVFMRRRPEITRLQQKNVKKKKRIICRVLNTFCVSSRFLFKIISLNRFVRLGIQNDLGVVNNGLVYALYDYEPDQSSNENSHNELAFKDGDQLRILRRGDENESEWWWAKHETTQQEGYVPRNYLGVCQDKLFKIRSIHSFAFSLAVSSSSTWINGFN